MITKNIEEIAGNQIEKKAERILGKGNGVPQFLLPEHCSVAEI